MSTAPLVSIIIPTFNRPQWVRRAVQSALNQTFDAIEVVVVDDGSTPAPELAPHPKLRVITLPANSGVSCARNAGAEAARGRWISFLDDDDVLLPRMVELSLEALADTGTLPSPVAVLSGLEIVDPEGQLIETHIPPTLPRGSHYSLEELKPGESIYCKQTLVVERDVFLSIGGCDTTFRSRVPSELFLRLNLACSLKGIPQITYRLTQHTGPRITRDRAQRQIGFYKLVNKHRALFETYPARFSWYFRDHAYRSWKARQYGPAIVAALRAFRYDPAGCIRSLLSPAPPEPSPPVRARHSGPADQGSPP